MRIGLVDASDPAWERALGRLAPHDVYHLPGYAALEARRMGGHPCALLAEDGDDVLLLPLVLVPLTVAGKPEDGLDASSPYGYPAPLLRGSAALAGSALAAGKALLAEKGVSSLFVRCHPLLGGGQAALAAHGTLVAHGETVWLDLSQDEAALWGQIRPRMRSYLNRLSRAGLTVHVDEGFSHYERFVALYHQTMAAAGAASWYFFDARYFDELRAALGPRLSLHVVEDRGEVISAALFTEESGIVQYHLSGTDKEQAHPDALKLLIHHGSLWAKRRGNRILHLGGGVGGERDPLFQFKAGFSKLRATFHSWRAVCDAQRYQAAQQSWRARTGREPEGDTGYFPPYRRS